MPEIFQKYLPEYARNMPEIYAKICQDMPEMCQENMPDMPEIYARKILKCSRTALFLPFLTWLTQKSASWHFPCVQHKMAIWSDSHWRTKWGKSIKESKCMDQEGRRGLWLYILIFVFVEKPKVESEADYKYLLKCRNAEMCQVWKPQFRQVSSIHLYQSH